MNSIRKSILFRREKMQPIQKAKTISKMVAIVGIIVIPRDCWSNHMKISKIFLAKLIHWQR